jgi:hypothetical protein
MADFGFIPAPLTVHLVADADFIQTITAVDGYPAGTVITLRIGTAGTAPGTWTAWPATVAGTTASWNVDRSVVAALVPGTRLRAELTYSDGAGVDLTWMQGGVVWHG